MHRVQKLTPCRKYQSFQIAKIRSRKTQKSPIRKIKLQQKFHATYGSPVYCGYNWKGREGKKQGWMQLTQAKQRCLPVTGTQYQHNQLVYSLIELYFLCLLLYCIYLFRYFVVLSQSCLCLSILWTVCLLTFTPTRYTVLSVPLAAGVYSLQVKFENIIIIIIIYLLVLHKFHKDDQIRITKCWR